MVVDVVAVVAVVADERVGVWLLTIRTLMIDDAAALSICDVLQIAVLWRPSRMPVGYSMRAAWR